MAKENITLLGIESSGATCAIGISIGSKLIFEISETGRYIHSEKLAPFVKQSLEKTSLTITDLDGVVISAGPGSFTGLRIGFSLAKGITHALNIPIIEIPTLDVIAHKFTERNEIHVLPVIDARRGEIFYALYLNNNHQIKRITDYQLIKVHLLSKIIKNDTLVFGDIHEELKSEIKKNIPQFAHFPDSKSVNHSMLSLHNLGFNKFIEKKYSDLQNCEPFYMRKFKGVS